MVAPGYQGALDLFPAKAQDGPYRFRVVDVSGRRDKPTPSLALAVGKARALAATEGRAWIVADDREAVEVVHGPGGFTVTPRGPGWPAVCNDLVHEGRHGEGDD